MPHLVNKLRTLDWENVTKTIEKLEETSLFKFKG